MNQNNNYQQQYDFDHYERVPLGSKFSRGKRGALGARMGRMLRTPMGATAGVLMVGVAFAAILINGFSGDDAAEAPPVIKAEQTAFKQSPADAGGMEIRHKDSTIFMAMNDQEAEESAPVENLLAEGGDESRLEAFYQQVEDAATEDEAAVSDELPTGGKIENLLAEAESSDVQSDPALQMAQDAVAMNGAEPAQVDDEGMDNEVPPPAEENLASSENTAPADAEVEVAQAPRIDPPRMPITHSAGSNPETLEYVRSVLEKKDGNAAARAVATRDHTADAASAVEPAAGTPASADVTPGSHYVQVGSVSSASGASSEWGKIQKAFPSQLSGLDHRVTTADLGAKGVFYRIQAGPMSKESAASICDAMKAQKPGACLVTQ